MKDVLLVGTGGFVGSVCRYTLSAMIARHVVGPDFPFGTLAVNVLGCCVGGALTGWMALHGSFTGESRLFLFGGVLGGFTTFSAFSLETVSLWRRGDAGTAALYVLVSIVGGLAAFWLALKAMSLTAR
jgi:CrcB protein